MAEHCGKHSGKRPAKTSEIQIKSRFDRQPFVDATRFIHLIEAPLWKRLPPGAMPTITLIVILSIVVGYPIGSRILLSKAQPRRLRLAELGRALLKRDDVAPRIKALVQSMLEDAYSPSFMINMMVLLPLAGAFFLVRRPKSREFELSSDAREIFDQFVDCHMLATSAANPVCALVVALEMSFLTLFLFPLGWSRKSRIVQVDAVERVEARGRQHALAA